MKLFSDSALRRSAARNRRETFEEAPEGKDKCSVVADRNVRPCAGPFTPILPKGPHLVFLYCLCVPLTSTLGQGHSRGAGAAEAELNCAVGGSKWTACGVCARAAHFNSANAQKPLR